MTFASFIKSAREQLNLTQGDLCRAVNDVLGPHLVEEHLKQGTLSAWETARQIPSERKSPRLDVLAATLGIKANELYATIGEMHLFRDVPADHRYVEDIRAWIDRIAEGVSPDDPASIWMLNAEVLPAFIEVKGEIKSLWKNNLEAGISYNLVWDISKTRRADIFMRLHHYIEQLSKSLKLESVCSAGNVNIHLIVPDSDAEMSMQANSLFEDYNKYHMIWRSRKGSSWTPVWNVPIRTTERIRKLAEAFDKWSTQIAGRLAVYIPPDSRPKESYACILLSNVRLSMRGPVVNRYCWLELQDVDELRKAINSANGAFKAYYAANTLPV